MPLPGRLPYYMTGPATRPGALRDNIHYKPPGPSKAKAKTKPKVVVTKPGSPVATSKAPTVKPQGTPKVKNPGVTGKVDTTPPKVKPKAPPKNKNPRTGVPSMGIGFNPQKMATTLTNLGYDADIAAIQSQIDTNKGNMAEALKDIQGWASQIESERARGAQESAAALQTAQGQIAGNDANIAALGGGVGGYENAAYANVGEDMLSAIGASDAGFDARMAPILAAQAADYGRRAQAAFGLQGKELQQNLISLLKEKGQAKQKNLLDLMDMAWGRKQDILQYQTAQQALQQAQALQGYDVAKAQQDIIKSNQDIQQGNLSLKSQQLALRKSKIELQKLQTQAAGGGLDWSDPNTSSSVGRGAMAGALAENGSLLINPKIAWQNAMTALGTLPGGATPQAVAAAWAHFQIALRTAHAHKRWGQYRIGKNGLIYDPTKKYPHK